MYFESREQAGMILADRLWERYRYENCAVVALSDGGVVVGEQIAAALHCVLTMLLVEEIEMPGENMSLGAVTQDGTFTYNSSLSEGERADYMGEFHGMVDEQKRQALSRIHHLIGDGGIMDHRILHDHVVILVSDGFENGMMIDAVGEFLKPIRLGRLVIAAPIASVPAVDRLHILADELHILDVKPNFLETGHYYENNSVPTHEEAVERINQIVLKWQ